MADKLLVEVEMNKGEAEEAVRALVYLANELIEYCPIEISEPVVWREKTSDDYRMKWRFTEDTQSQSSGQVVISADLAIQLTETLRTAQTALNEKRNHRNGTMDAALEAIERTRSAFTDSIVKAEPELEHFFYEAVI
jgi:hypothetical protein